LLFFVTFVKPRDRCLKMKVTVFTVCFPGMLWDLLSATTFPLITCVIKGLSRRLYPTLPKMGTVIPLFYAMSGPWSEFVLNYLDTGIPTLNLRYEELSQESLGE
jgi:hypothetical protein